MATRIASYSGRYGHYVVKRKSGWFGTNYYIYKDGEYWRSASSRDSAYTIIKRYDPYIVSED